MDILPDLSSACLVVSVQEGKFVITSDEISNIFPLYPISILHLQSSQFYYILVYTYYIIAHWILCDTKLNHFIGTVLKTKQNKTTWYHKTSSTRNIVWHVTLIHNWNYFSYQLNCQVIGQNTHAWFPLAYLRASLCGNIQIKDSYSYWRLTKFKQMTEILTPLTTGTLCLFWGKLWDFCHF